MATKPGPGLGPVKAFDRHVSARIPERRVALGFTQQQFGKLIGVTYQQVHKYEKGMNRISAGRLYRIARVLGVDIDYFFEGIEPRTIRSDELMPQRLLLALMRNFIAILGRKHQEEIVSLARALAEPDERRPARPARAD